MNTQQNLVKFGDFLTLENSKVCAEWDSWDGSDIQAQQINDRQCARLVNSKRKCGVTSMAYSESLSVEAAPKVALGKFYGNAS